MAKQWVVREKISDDLVRQILFYRGVKEEKEIEKFLNPDYEKGQYDPFLMKDMDKAVERILRAVKNNEKVVIYGDYDADGVCSSAIFHEFFKKIGFNNFHIHIPDRHMDGYGLNSSAIDEFKNLKVNLVITLDCGISDYEEVEELNKAGIDTVITDHHLTPEKLPNAHAVVDSKQKDDSYPFKFLCGAGVAFKTIQALIKKGDFNITFGWERWLLDLVCLATIADMVPLVDENRVLAGFGLKVLRKTQRAGLKSFYRRLSFNSANLNEDDISFMLVPRLNVSGRMDHANASFELLVTESAEEADWITGKMEMMTAERKSIVEDITKEINEKIKQAGGAPEIIVAGNMDWNTGVLGMTASRVVEKYNRPVFLWGKGGAKEIKGSARSDGSISVVDLMNAVAEGVLIEAGGHAMAGGFSVSDGKIGDLEKEILAAFAKIPKQATDGETLHIDKELKIEDVNEETYAAIEKLSPFGKDNPKSVFLFSDLEIFNVRKFGNGGIHLQLDFKKTDGGVVSAISFFSNGNNHRRQASVEQPTPGVGAGQRIDLVATLEKSFFRVTPELRLRIVDVKLKHVKIS
ncbi:MAG: single-stranded-DNA-specific exonuclease RecJ [Candidatus Paceibacterota bacterium]